MIHLFPRPTGFDAGSHRPPGVRSRRSTAFTGEAPRRCVGCPTSPELPESDVKSERRSTHSGQSVSTSLEKHTTHFCSGAHRARVQVIWAPPEHSPCGRNFRVPPCFAERRCLPSPPVGPVDIRIDWSLQSISSRNHVVSSFSSQQGPNETCHAFSSELSVHLVLSLIPHSKHNRLL